MSSEAKREIFSRIEEAKALLRPVIYRTPLIASRMISELSGSEARLRTENLQRTGSFKVRGAYCKMRKVEGLRGVVAASSGNHAQG